MSKAEIYVRDFFSAAGTIKDEEDFYSIAGLAKTATLEEIKKAYKKLALQLHPDKNFADPEKATKIFQRMSDAYADLLNPTQVEQQNPPSEEDVRVNQWFQEAQQRRHEQYEQARRQEFCRQQEAQKERLNQEQKEIFDKIARKILPIINPTKANIPIKLANEFQEVGDRNSAFEENTDANLSPQEDRDFFNALKFVKNFLEKKFPPDATPTPNEPKVATDGIATTRVNNRFIRQLAAIATNDESLDEGLAIFEKLQNLIYYQQQKGQERHLGHNITFDAEADKEAINFFNEHQDEVLVAVQSYYHQQNISQNIEFLYNNVCCDHLAKAKNNLQFLINEGKSHQDIQQGRMPLLTHAAANNSSIQTVKYLVEEAKFDPLEPSISEGKSTNALLEAAQHSFSTVFKYFYGKFRKAGQDPLQQTKPNCETILHKAVKAAKPPHFYPGTKVVFGEEEFDQRLIVIKFLIEQGAALDAKDENGQIPAQLAMSKKVLMTISQAASQKNAGAENISSSASASTSEEENSSWIERLFSPAWTSRKRTSKVYCDSTFNNYDNNSPESSTSASQALKLTDNPKGKFH